MNPFIILSVLGGLFLLAKSSQAAPTSTSDPEAPRTQIVPITDAAKIAQKAMQDGYDAVQRQAIWLNDNGCPETSAALFKYLNGAIPSSMVLLVANLETKKLS